MKRATLWGVAMVAMWLGLALPARAADLGTAFTYQGRLRLEGLPLNQACDLQFSLWTAAEGGSQVGTPVTAANVLPSGGEFAAELDFGAVAFAGEARFLEVAVRCPAGGGSYVTLAPRQPLLAAPYALYAPASGESATTLSAPWTGLGGMPAGFADGVDNDTQYTAGSGLQLSGSSFSIPNKGVTTALLADNAVTTGKILDGTVAKADLAAGGGSEGQVLKLGSGGALTWADDGVTLPEILDGSYYVALLQVYNNYSGFAGAIYAVSRALTILATTDSDEYSAFLGTNSYANNEGYLGAVDYGASGYDRDNENMGGLGSWSCGVFGWHNASQNYAYLASTDYGAYARRGDDTSLGYLAGSAGVYGRNITGLADRYAGYFNGPARVIGYLTKSGGGFQIDHPLDPAGRYLSHSFVESPDMKNVYDGVAVLDDEGRAEVVLPEWFEALNRDFRYQLTCIGGFAPVYIAEEISGNRFRIAGGTRGLKVSWQVTGTRQDAWAEANRLVVETDKPAADQGRYLHPELYGKAAANSVDRMLAEPPPPARPAPAAVEEPGPK